MSGSCRRRRRPRCDAHTTACAARDLPPGDARPSLPMRQAAGFADAALRRVLEVIDRRRPVAQLRPCWPPDSSTRCCRPLGAPRGRTASRCCAGCAAGSVARARDAAEVFGELHAAGRACTPSPAASSRSPPRATVAGRRAAYRLSARAWRFECLALAAARPRAVPGGCRRRAPAALARRRCRCTCAEPSSAGPV